MGWRKILKSSRDEAYEVFLQEFGPEVDFDSIPFDTEVEKYGLIGHEWLVSFVNGRVFLRSDKYNDYIPFVRGMFVEEYPKRYKEIKDKLEEIALMSLPSDMNPEKVLTILSKYLHKSGILDDTHYEAVHGRENFPNFILDALDITLQDLENPKISNTHHYYYVRDKFIESLRNLLNYYTRESYLTIQDINRRVLLMEHLLDSMFLSTNNDNKLEFKLPPNPPPQNFLSEIKTIIENEKV